eukprot:766441-Hanusia_phi.AAC.2
MTGSAGMRVLQEGPDLDAVERWRGWRARDRAGEPGLDEFSDMAAGAMGCAVGGGSPSPADP